ncbi:hypothetical protein OIO90_000185 [Microbotryomycetes sp. JL221]|nr:hypothetical protein OIO90_000185 [Microbotryomycetes sp. JL221]
MDDYTRPPQGPPAYELESSSDEEDCYDDDEDYASPAQQGQRKAHRANQLQASQAEPTIEVQGQVTTGTSVVFLVGEAGEYIGRGVDTGSSDASASVTVDGQQMASIVALPTQVTIVFLSCELRLANLHALASHLMQILAPTSATTVTSYHLPSYLSDKDFVTPPILFLQSPPSAEVQTLVDEGDLTPFAPPNLLHGLAAALVTLSSLAGVPSLLLLLPSITQPPPLNGPWSAMTSSNTFYDAGPTGLSNPEQVLNDVKTKLLRVAQRLNWNWWRSDASGREFQWLEKQRRQRRKQEMSSTSMYM